MPGLPDLEAEREESAMHWFVDGYNVIRRAPELAARERESLEAGRQSWIKTFSRESTIRRSLTIGGSPDFALSSRRR